MKPRKNVRKHATGPVTAAGKKRSAMNAVTHGVLSTKVLLPNESKEEFALLMDDIARDLRPVGAMEHLLAEKIAALLWRKRRWEAAETDVIDSVQKQPVTDTELKEALGLSVENLPPWMMERSEGFDGFEFISRIHSLPDWMLEEHNTPTEAAGKEAVLLCAEWDLFQQEGMDLRLEAQAAQHFPVHWKRLQADMAASRDGDNAAFYLQIRFQRPDFSQNFEAFMLEQQQQAHWVAYWHQDRDRMATAFRVIRVKRMLAAWDLDRSHRYHTMLDNQLFKLLREFRDMRAWRLSTLELTDEGQVGRADLH